MSAWGRTERSEVPPQVEVWAILCKTETFKQGNALMMFRLLLLGLCMSVCSRPVSAAEKTPFPKSLRILVMDPLAKPLSCPCVLKIGQRNYHQLASHLQKGFSCQVEVSFFESLPQYHARHRLQPHLIIGKESVVRFDANRKKLSLSPLVQLTDLQGKTTLRGIVIVRQNDPAKSLLDLKTKQIFLGPLEERDSHDAARNLFQQWRLTKQIDLKVAGSMRQAAYAVHDNEADAAVISDYLLPIIHGCGAVEPGSFRVIGQTKEVPFVTLFATELVPASWKEPLVKSLLKISQDEKLLKALESKHGFVAWKEKQFTPERNSDQKEKSHQKKLSKEENAPESTGWTDWRGKNRDGLSSDVPRQLPASLKQKWAAKVTGPALAGISATEEYVVVPDKNRELTKDIFQCFDARTGRTLWYLEYPAGKKLDYTNAPRAVPVIKDELVYLLGALGDLHCVELKTGKIVWKLNLVTKFHAELPNWGYASPPLIVDEKLIVNPGAKNASIVALNRKTGEVLWQTPGHAAAYSAFRFGSFQGVSQVVGYDVAGLGGWDIRTGKRLWNLIPPAASDFNVGTPILLKTKTRTAMKDQLLVATENNGTRLYEFDPKGHLNSKPIAENQDLAPDSITPVVWKDRLFCAAYGELFCLDLKNNLKTIWKISDDMFYEHTNLIAGNDRILLWTTEGDLLLIDALSPKYRVISHLKPLSNPTTKKTLETMSHPAIVGSSLYLRSARELVCFELPSKGDE